MWMQQQCVLLLEPLTCYPLSSMWAVPKTKHTAQSHEHGSTSPMAWQGPRQPFTHRHVLAAGRRQQSAVRRRVQRQREQLSLRTAGPARVRSFEIHPAMK
jgi:hypothetical protein